MGAWLGGGLSQAALEVRAPRRCDAVRPPPRLYARRAGCAVRRAVRSAPIATSRRQIYLESPARFAFPNKFHEARGCVALRSFIRRRPRLAHPGPARGRHVRAGQSQGRG